MGVSGLFSPRDGALPDRPAAGRRIVCRGRFEIPGFGRPRRVVVSLYRHRFVDRRFGDGMGVRGSARLWQLDPRRYGFGDFLAPLVGDHRHRAGDRHLVCRLGSDVQGQRAIA